MQRREGDKCHQRGSQEVEKTRDQERVILIRKNWDGRFEKGENID